VKSIFFTLLSARWLPHSARTPCWARPTAHSELSYSPGSRTPVKCGDIVQGEFTENEQKLEFEVDMAPGDVIQVSGDTVGDYLTFDLDVISPLGRYVIGRDYPDCLDKPSGETKELSERGTYTIEVRSCGTGIYTLFLGCVLHDGLVIGPGDIQAENITPSQGTEPDVPAFSGFGFPGLAPVDFASITRFPLIEGLPLSGVITPTGDEIIGSLMTPRQTPFWT
jgi:hypothetical protein